MANKSRVNADSPRDPGVGTEGARPSADSPRGSGPGVNTPVRLPNSSYTSLGSSDPPHTADVSANGQVVIESGMQQMIQDPVERILAEARSAESPHEVSTSQDTSSQHKEANEPGGASTTGHFTHIHGGGDREAPWKTQGSEQWGT